MKILLYTSVPSIANTGGTERVFCEMSNALTTRGHTVYAVCNDFRPARPSYPLDDRVQFVNLDGSGYRERKPFIWKIFRPFRSIAPKMWNRYIRDPFDNKKIEPPLMRLIREVQPDVVILYHVDDYFSMLRQPMLDVPVILMHHYSAGDFTQSVNTREREIKINTCSHLQVLQRSFLPEIQRLYHGKIYVIPNAVPQIEEKDLANLAVAKPQKIITMVSRLMPKKQQHMLIQAFGRLAKDYPEWKVEIYGSLDERRYPRKLKKMITSLGLTGRVELLGTTDRPLDVLRQADIFAFPSNHPEGWGLALTEAMAVGLPCVGLKNTPSVNELIVDGVNGFLTDNTSEDFATKLKILMEDCELRQRMGAAGHEMMKRYAPEKIWEQWEKLIEKVVQGHSCQTPNNFVT